MIQDDYSASADFDLGSPTPDQFNHHKLTNEQSPPGKRPFRGFFSFFLKAVKCQKGSSLAVPLSRLDLCEKPRADRFS
jgi:hypothetical protein